MKAPVTGNGELAYEPVPQGKYLAMCNGVYMLGSQPGYKGAAEKPQVMLTFELHKRKGPARRSDGNILEISRIMSFTFNEKATLTEFAAALLNEHYTEARLEQIKGEGGFDPELLLGRGCWMDVIQEKGSESGKLKNKITGVSPLDPDDDAPPAMETDDVYWDWTLGHEVPNRIAYFWDRAKENPNRKQDPEKAALPAGKPATPDDDGDNRVPF
jgi:hypothetical protein